TSRRMVVVCNDSPRLATGKMSAKISKTVRHRNELSPGQQIAGLDHFAQCRLSLCADRLGISSAQSFGASVLALYANCTSRTTQLRRRVVSSSTIYQLFEARSGTPLWNGQ